MRKGGQKTKVDIVRQVIEEQNRPITANEIVTLAPRRSGLTSVSVSQIISRRLKDIVEVCGLVGSGAHNNKVNLYKLRDKDECTTTNS
jgi:hypothetical protein